MKFDKVEDEVSATELDPAEKNDRTPGRFFLSPYDPLLYKLMVQYYKEKPWG